MKRLAILGSTGSIGANTLDVAARHPDRFEVFALAAGKNVERLVAQCVEHRPRYAVMTNADAAEKLRAALATQAPDIEVLGGSEALEGIAAHARSMPSWRRSWARRASRRRSPRPARESRSSSRTRKRS
jgi:1-deoxy-D-xylulose-5-phosphate reductoisomerase